MDELAFERFMKNVVITDDHWFWTGEGRFGTGSYRTKAHRIMYLQIYGTIPDELVVRHKCKVKKCVNPEHLELGTVAENNLDKIRDGTINRGEKVWNTKLTETQVKEIREIQGMTHQQIADMYGIARRQVGRIRDGSRWSWIK